MKTSWLLLKRSETSSVKGLTSPYLPSTTASLLLPVRRRLHAPKGNAAFPAKCLCVRSFGTRYEKARCSIVKAAGGCSTSIQRFIPLPSLLPARVLRIGLGRVQVVPFKNETNRCRHGRGAGRRPGRTPCSLQS